ncbi:MAG: hypothetical protein ACYTFG_20300 [Planctomycetota bacterium]
MKNLGIPKFLNSLIPQLFNPKSINPSPLTRSLSRSLNEKENEEENEKGDEEEEEDGKAFHHAKR